MKAHFPITNIILNLNYISSGHRSAAGSEGDLEAWRDRAQPGGAKVRILLGTWIRVAKNCEKSPLVRI